MLIAAVVPLPKRIISFRQVNRKSAVLMTRDIEKWRIVVSQRLIVKRLEFVIVVV